MQTKMKINIILYPKSREDFKSIDLYNKSEVEFLISECKNQGECDIEAHAVTEEAP